MPGEFSFAVMRRYPRIYRAGCPSSVCLAPHGVFLASRITPRAVSSYLAFSPLPALLSKNRRCVFCDTFRQRPLSRTSPACFTRHAAVWCSDFPPANPADAGPHQRSSAIAPILAHSGLIARGSLRQRADFNQGKVGAVFRQPEMQWP